MTRIANRPVRKFIALLAAGMLALTGAGMIVLSTAQSASAAPVTIDTPAESTVFLTNSQTFTGSGDDGDLITVDLGGGTGNGCSTTVVGTTWSCNVTNLVTTQFYVITASRSVDGVGQDSEGKEYSVVLPPVLTQGNFIGNDNQPTVTGTADPGATVDVTVGGFTCNPGGVYTDPVIADPSTGAWTCDLSFPLDSDNTYPVLATQTPTWSGTTSTAATSNYTLDTQVAEPTFTAPFDTFSGPTSGSSSRTSPQVSGNDAEGGSSVFVMYGNTQPDTPYCNAIADGSGSWSCNSAVTLTVGNTYSFGVGQTDLAGNTTPQPLAEQFTYFVLAPPGPPTVDTPTGGYASLDPYVYFSGHAGYFDMSVLVNGSESCSAFIDDSSNFTCTGGPYAPGNYVAEIFVRDFEGTPSAHVFRAFTILGAGVIPPATITPTSTPTPPPLNVKLKVTDQNGNDLTGKPVKAGQVVVITGTDAPPGSTADIELHSTPMALGSTIVGPSGNFALTTLIPTTVEPGDHHFVATITPLGQTPAVFETAATIEPADVIAQKSAEQPSKDDVIAFLNALATANEHGFNSPSSFSSTLKTTNQVVLTPATLGITGLVASAFLLLVAFPSELLEATIRENYERVFGWTAPIKRRVEKIKHALKNISINKWLATVGIIALTALILGFSDPNFGVNGSSLRLWIALVVSIVLLNVVVSSIVMSVAKRSFSVDSTLEPMPAALLLVALSVIVSRVIGIQPGFLFGVVLGIAFAVELRKKQDALLVLLGVGLSIVIGIASWVGYSALATSAAEPGFWHLLLQETLAATTVEALATMTIALLPLTFLDGKTIFEWNRWAWAGVYALAVVAFIVVILPLSDNWGQMSAPLFGWGVFFTGFAVLAVGIWAGFRFLPSKARTAS